MAQRKPPLTAKLVRTTRTNDGRTLRTRGEAADYMTGLPEQRVRYQHGNTRQSSCSTERTLSD
jgi:hypothetical protein